MSATSLTDIIVPEVFTPYLVNKTMELSALYQSGIITNDTEFDALASAAASIVNMPYFSDLSGESEAMTEAAITPDKIGTAQDMAAILRRVKSWGSTGLAAALSGADPMAAIGNLAAAFWARDMQKELIAILKGIFGAASMSGLVQDISGGTGAAAVWSGDAFVDACQLLGDAKGTLTAVAVHSMTEALLKKQDLIDYIQPSAGGLPIPYYQGKRLIIDDGCPAAAGVYTSFLFGQGAIGLGNGTPAGITPTETVRNAMTGSGEDVLINRKNYILHPRGIKYKGTPAAKSGPTRVELGTATNWERVYDVKKIRVVEFKHKLA